MSEFGDISRMKLADLGPEDPDQAEELLDIEREAGQETEQADDSALENERFPADETKTDGEAPDVEAVDEKEHMAEPVGQHYYVDARITAKELRAFLFAHNYRSPLMLVAILIGVVWPIYTVITANGSVFMAVFCAAVFLFLMPFSIWYRGGATVKKNPTYQHTFHYMLDEAGLHLELGEQAIDVEWNQVIKVLCLGSSTALFTGKTNAFLIPTEAMGSRRDEINSFIKNQVKR